MSADYETRSKSCLFLFGKCYRFFVHTGLLPQHKYEVVKKWSSGVIIYTSVLLNNKNQQLFTFVILHNSDPCFTSKIVPLNAWLLDHLVTTDLKPAE